MSLKIVIPIRLPGLNEYVRECRGNKYQAAAFKRQVEDDCLIFIKSALRGKTLTCVRLSFLWVEPNKQRDKDNICFAKKFILDALQKGRFLANDGWNQIDSLQDRFTVDKDHPRVEISIEEV